MKKALVPISIILFILVFAMVKGLGNEHQNHRIKRTKIPQPSTLVGDYETSEEENDIITVIGEPSTSSNNITIEENNTEFYTTDENLSLNLVEQNALRPEQIISHKGYTTSYNNKTKCPNWVAWHLTREHTDGPYHRRGIPYYADDGAVYGIGKITPETFRNNYFVDLEAEEPRQEHSDWLERPSDIDHGHMCPAGDNKWDKAAMNQSYLLTNMCPQNSSLNSGGWNKLEEKCRKWAIRYGDIYIVAGPIFYNGVRRTFGANKIAIPDAFFKVVLCLAGKPKAIGFIYENDSRSQSMFENCCSVDHIEEITGFDFFSSLPDDVEDIIEIKTNVDDWK